MNTMDRRIKRRVLVLLCSLIVAVAAFSAAETLPGAPVNEHGDTSMALDRFGFTSGNAQSDAEADTPVSPPATDSAAPLEAADPWPKTITVTVGGDCTLGSLDMHRELIEGFDYVVNDMGYAWPFSELLQVFGQDDLTLVNFEGALTESEDKQSKLYNFKGPAEYASMLVSGSVEAVNLANNHFGDYGEQGETDTKEAMDAYGITYCAPGQTAIYETRGVKIGLIGNTFAYKNGECDISRSVKALREEGCQIIIASFHWGSEYNTSYTRDQRNIGRAAVKSGADVVVGHHPHVIQGIEQYEDTYILYSLANLVFGGNIDPDPEPRDTYIAQLAFTVHEDGTVEGPELTILPMRVTAQTSGTDYRPVFAQGEEYERILNKIINRSPNMEDFVNPQ